MKPDQIKVYGFWDWTSCEDHRSRPQALGVDADVRHIVAYRTAVEGRRRPAAHVFTADPLSDYSDEDIRLLVRGERPTGTGPMANILRGPYIVPTIEMRQAYARAASYPELLEHPRFAEQLPPDVYEHLRQTWSNPAAIPWGIGRDRARQSRQAEAGQFIAAGGREQIVAGYRRRLAAERAHPAVLREIRNLHEAGLTAMEAIQAATLRPAQMQGVTRTLGTRHAGQAGRHRRRRRRSAAGHCRPSSAIPFTWSRMGRWSNTVWRSLTIAAAVASGVSRCCAGTPRPTG